MSSETIPAAQNGSSHADLDKTESTIDVKDLLESGMKLYFSDNFTEAADALGDACSLLALKHGERSLECADAYLYYGASLIQLGRAENGLLSNIGQNSESDPEQNNDDDEEEEEEEEETKKEVTEANTETAKKPATNGTAESGATGDAPDKSKTESDASSKDTTETETNSSKPENGADEVRGNADADEKDDSTDEAVEKDDDNDSSDNEPIEESSDSLQLAWETLQLLVSILEKETDVKSLTKLANAHRYIGEICMENEQFEEALEEYNKSLKIFEDHLPNEHREIASIKYQVALVYCLMPDNRKAIESFGSALASLEAKIGLLKSQTSSSGEAKSCIADEIKDLENLSAEIHTKIAEVEAAFIDEERVRKLLKEQLGKVDSLQSAADIPSNSKVSSSSAKLAESSSNGLGSSDSSSVPVQDVTHLVKKKSPVVSSHEASNVDEAPLKKRARVE